MLRKIYGVFAVGICLLMVGSIATAADEDPPQQQVEKREYDPQDRDTRTVRKRPKDAIDSNTTTDEDSDVRGFFTQLGMAGGLEVGSGSDLDLGPGFQLGVGYVFKGPVGLRGSFTFLSMDSEHVQNADAQLYNGSLDLMIFPMYRSRFFIQPYLVFGPGYYYIHSDQLNLANHGVGGNVGLGANIHLGEHFALGLENNFRPVMFFKNSENPEDDKYFYSFTGFGTFFF